MSSIILQVNNEYVLKEQIKKIYKKNKKKCETANYEMDERFHDMRWERLDQDIKDEIDDLVKCLDLDEEKRFFRKDMMNAFDVLEKINKNEDTIVTTGITGFDLGNLEVTTEDGKITLVTITQSGSS